jgi:hypothetical protein
MRCSLRIVRGLFAALTASALSVGKVAGQEVDGSDARGRWTVAGGFVRYGTGGSGCAHGNGLVAGLEVNTRGSWLLGLGAGLVHAGPTECISIGRLGLYEDRWVELRGGARFANSPQVTVRAGKAVRLGSGLVEPALAGGFLRGRGEPQRWKPWYGGSLRLAVGSFPLSLQVDHGRHSVTMQFVEHQQLLAEYERWEPITVISLRW